MVDRLVVSVPDTARKAGQALAFYHKFVEDNTPRTLLMQFTQVSHQSFTDPSFISDTDPDPWIRIILRLKMLVKFFYLSQISFLIGTVGTVPTHTSKF